MSARATAAAVALAAALATALVTLAIGERSSVLEEDEGDYLRAATHLLRDGVFAHSSIDSTAPAPDAYREPGISAIYAAAWRLAGCAPPASEAALPAALAAGSCTGRAVRAVDLLLFGATLAATALAIRAAGGGRLAALAGAALVAWSPALRLAASGAWSESLAAPLVVGVSAALALRQASPTAAQARRRRAATAVAIALAALAPLARSALLALPVAVAATLLLDGAKASRGRRVARSLAALAIAVLPAAFWVVRTARSVGVVAFVDSRGVLKIREELDRQIAVEGALATALRWTPLAAAQARADRLAPSTLDRPRWTGEGNYLTRAWRERREAMRIEAERSGRPPEQVALVVDRARARSALSEFVHHPLDHLRASAAVAWRSLFAERSPDWARPFDLTLGIGIVLAVALLALLIPAIRRNDGASLALLLPAMLLGLGHILLTEGVPRYGWPELPIAWAAVALVLGRKGRGVRAGAKARTA